ncbi:unnamed protein product [Didymodactylos carnosus]|uniref:Gag-like protein n=1 Tax=Didymodactylos carnosus TaxID=1234261 RepID=A0A814PTW5_9BILA|nr:unnamed protein product [Didymodactylos carnosus]CAF3874786.1 unnamed protein product [Didymodactylos carnosus]
MVYRLRYNSLETEGRGLQPDPTLGSGRARVKMLSGRVRQFHRTWNEAEILQDMKEHYPSLVQLTGMYTKNDTTLNGVRADFMSIKDVESLLVDGKIYINQTTHVVRPYYKPLRINKCMKCFHHDHKTKECPNQQVCARCGEQHGMSNGCERQEKCVNCSDQHSAGHPSCPIVQRIR